MAMEGKTLGRGTCEASRLTSYFAKMQKEESDTFEVVSTLISRYQSAMKRREMSRTDSIWDFDMSTAQVVNKSLRKSTEDNITPKSHGIVGRPSNYVLNTTANKSISNRNEIGENRPLPPRNISEDEPDFLDQLFPDIPPNFAFVTVNDRRATNQPVKKPNLSENKRTAVMKSRFDQTYPIKEVSEKMKARKVNGDSLKSKSNGEKYKAVQKTSLFCQTKELPLNLSSRSADVTVENGATTMNNQCRGNATRPFRKYHTQEKSFEEWSRERLLGKIPHSNEKLEPPLVPSPTLKPITKDLSELETEPQLTMETDSPATLIPITEELYELEEDYFYGVRHDRDDFNTGECFPDNVALGSSEHHIESVPEENLCRVSDFMKQFSEDTTESQEFHDILKQMEQGRNGAKRKSSATQLSPKSKTCPTKRNRQNLRTNSWYLKDFLGTSAEMINVQVSDEKENLELTVVGMEIFELKENYSSIFNIFPMVDLEEITLPWSACAMVIVLRYVLQIMFEFPSWDVVIEVFAIAKEYNINKLEEGCKIFFEEHPIETVDIKKFTQLVKQFGVEEILQYAMTFQVSERPTFQIPDVFESKSCTISCTMHKDAKVFSVPMFPCCKGDLGSIKKNDLQNELYIHSTQGIHTVTGVGINLNVDASEMGKKGTVVCDVYKGREIMLEMVKDIELQNNVVVRFSRKITLGPRESIKIVLLIEDIKSSWCQCLKNEEAEYGGGGKILHVKFKSRNKTSVKHSLFFIDKVFYMN